MAYSNNTFVVDRSALNMDLRVLWYIDHTGASHQLAGAPSPYRYPPEADHIVSFHDLHEAYTFLTFVMANESSPPTRPVAEEPKPTQELQRFGRPEGDPMVIENFVQTFSQRNNDCPVVALANITQMSYVKAKQTCFLHGWSSTSGLVDGMLEVILQDLGYKTHSCLQLARGTAGSFEQPDGCFLVMVEGHVMPVVNGKILNVGDTGWRIVRDVVEIRK